MLLLLLLSAHFGDICNCNYLYSNVENGKVLANGF